MSGVYVRSVPSGLAILKTERANRTLLRVDKSFGMGDLALLLLTQLRARAVSHDCQAFDEVLFEKAPSMTGQMEELKGSTQ